MKVFFTASLSGKVMYQEYYDTVINTLRNNSIDIISKEVQEYTSILDPKQIKNLSKDEIHYLFVKKGISISNAVIIEVSVINSNLVTRQV